MLLWYSPESVSSCLLCFIAILMTFSKCQVNLTLKLKSDIIQLFHESTPIGLDGCRELSLLFISSFSVNTFKLQISVTKE